MKINSETRELARKIWDYLKMNQKLEKADCILVLGSRDTRVAERGAQLFLEGWAPLIVFSGGLGNFTRCIWREPEADKFSRIAIKIGVPRENILVENKSTNTGENIRFSYKLLKSKNILPKKMILVQKPYMERRTYATFIKQWPDQATKIMVTSPQIPFEQYPNEQISMEEVINIMVGELQRIKIYPQKGFQIFQEIPEDVRIAYEKLVKLGYTKYLIRE
jgi:uncharacterized SAM-binding protein YcdF (DUF218 family)